MAAKTDLTKKHPDYYKAGQTPVVVEFGKLPYIQISGVGAPEGENYQTSIAALYEVGYAIKFQYKELEQDFVVPKLESYWWVESGIPFLETPQEQWHWKLTMRMPDFVNPSHIVSTIQELIQTSENPNVASISFAELNEGKCIQCLHIGPYNNENETIELLMQYAQDNGFTIVGQHHEIYLSDPRRAKPENLKTLIRYSVV